MLGVEMMLKQAGIDIPKAIKDFEDLKAGVLKTLGNIEARLQGIEKRQEEIWKTITEQPQPQTPPQQPLAPKLLNMPQQPQPVNQ